MNDIDVYAVGLWRDVWHFAMIKPGRWRRLAHDLRRPFALARNRQWRDLKNYFNGYLAEPSAYVVLPRCGSGWTRNRAYRDLIRRMAS